MKLVSLKTWLHDTYGEDAPHLNTARRWCQDGLIYPQPVKHGRGYYLHPDAAYTGGSELVRKLHAAHTAQP